MRKATIGLGVGGFLWVALPVTLLVLLTVASVSANISGPQAPSWVPVRESDSTTNDPIDLALQWEPSASVFAPAWNGLVQTVQVKQGETIADGTPIATIDGITRIAALTPAPLYRSISVGMRGSDVRWLNDFLGRLGYAHGATESVTAATVQGTKQLAVVIGAPFQGSFDASWLIFIPGSAFKVQTVSLTPGIPAPVAGSKILDSTTRLSRATVVTFGSLNALVTQEQSASNASPIALSNSAIRTNIKKVPTGTRLDVSGTTIPLDASSSVLTSAFPQLESAAAPQVPLLQANLVRVPKSGDFWIPSAAIFSGASGKTCVVENVNGRARVVEIQLVADSGGGVVVTGNLGLHRSVRVPGGSQAQCN